MVETLKVGYIEAPQGEKKFGWLQVADMQDSRPAELPIALINGVENGPTLYLQAAIDGDELNPIGVLRTVVRELDPKKLQGRVIATLFANYFGFHAKEAFNPIDKVSMNRVWPGRENGSSSERIAHEIWNKIVLQCNYAIDVHQTGTSPSVGSVYVRVGKDEPFHDTAFEMAKTFGMGYILDEKESKIYASDEFNPKSAETKLSWQATVRGIPTITPELPGCRGWDKSPITKGVRGIFNVMKSLNMLEGAPEVERKQHVVRHLRNILSSRGGFIEFREDLGSMIKKDSVVAEITDPFGESLERIASPEDAILWRVAEYPMVSSGEYVATLGTSYETISS